MINISIEQPNKIFIGSQDVKVYVGSQLVYPLEQPSGDLPIFIGEDNKSLVITTKYPIETRIYDADWNSTTATTYLDQDIVISDLTTDVYEMEYMYYPSLSTTRADINARPVAQDVVINGETYTSYWQYLTTYAMASAWYSYGVNNKFYSSGGTPDVQLKGTPASTYTNGVLPMQLLSLTSGSTYKLSGAALNGWGQADEVGWIVCTDLNDIDNTTLCKISATSFAWNNSPTGTQKDTPATISTETPTFKYEGGNIYIIGFGKRMRGFSYTNGWSLGWEQKISFAEIPDPAEKNLSIMKTVFEADGMEDLQISASGDLATYSTLGLRVYSNGEAALLGEPEVETKYYKTAAWTQPTFTSQDDNEYGLNGFGAVYLDSNGASIGKLFDGVSTGWRERDGGYQNMYVSFGDRVMLESVSFEGLKTSSSSNSKAMTISVSGSEDGLTYSSLASSLSITPKNTATTYTVTMNPSWNKYCRFLRITISNSQISGIMYMNQIKLNGGTYIVAEGTADDHDYAEDKAKFKVISGKQ